MAKKTSKAVMSAKRFMAAGLAAGMLFTGSVSAAAEPLATDAETRTTVTVAGTGSAAEDGSTDKVIPAEKDDSAEEDGSTEEGGSEKADSETLVENGSDKKDEPDGNGADAETTDKNLVVNEETADREAAEEDADGATEIAPLSEESGELLPATNLRWSEETPGTAVFHNPNDSNVSYTLHVFKDGKDGWSPGCTSGTNIGAGDKVISVTDFIEDSGVYTFQVELFEYGVAPDVDISSGCVSEESPAFEYSRPSLQLAVPSNIKWSKDGVVLWDRVEHAKNYSINLLRKEADGSYYHVSGSILSSTSKDWKGNLAEGYDYVTRVRAFSEDITQYVNGEWSDYIPFDNSPAGDNTDNKLDAAIGSDPITADNVAGVVANVKNSFNDAASKSELQVAMQTDSDTQAKIKELEDTYSAAMNLNVVVNPAADTGIDQSSVKLLGAALNATQSGTVTFNMSKPDEEMEKSLIANGQFGKAIVLDLGLEGAGINRGEILAIPVTVTMNAPAGMDISRLLILHYNADNTNYETLPVRKNADGTISFTVTHFSNFVFAERKAGSGSSDGGKDTDELSSVDTSFYGAAASADESSFSGGSSYANGAPAWRPVTPDEQKRFAAMGTERVVYTVSMGSAYTVQVVNAMQGKLCFDVLEEVLKTLDGYQIGRTYNIFPSGRTVYEMEHAATITLTIPEKLQAAGREFKMICVTKGGQPVVLDDLDRNPETITFTTDSYYAYALIYKDAAAK